MDFDFLPSKPENPQTSPGTGGSFAVGKKVFIDKYTNHLDAHKVFSIPPVRSEFQMEFNYILAKEGTFSDERINNNIRDNKYGANTTIDQLKAGYTQFQNPKLLDDTLGKIDSNISADLFSGIEKPKMKINDRFGMFSFDLASMAMTYVYEYFDKKENKVDANFVEKKNDKFYFENEEVQQRIKKRSNGSPYVVSSVRNSLIDFEKKSKQDRSVEIFVYNSASWSETPERFIYNSMAAISVAKNLILKGFQVKLTALVCTEMGGTEYYHFVPSKNFNQPLDINAAAYILGDSRFFRFQGFKLIVHGADENNKNCDPGLGSPITDKQRIARVIETDYITNSKLKQGDTRLYFGGSRSLEDSKKEVKDALTILNANYGKP